MNETTQIIPPEASFRAGGPSAPITGPELDAEMWAPEGQSTARPLGRAFLRVELLKLKRKMHRGFMQKINRQIEKVKNKGAQIEGSDMCLVLRPRTRADSDAVTARVVGGVAGGGALEVQPHEAEEELFVQIFDAGELVGTVRIPIPALWSTLEMAETADILAPGSESGGRCTLGGLGRREEPYKAQGRMQKIGERVAAAGARLRRTSLGRPGSGGAAGPDSSGSSEACLREPVPFELIVKDDMGQPVAKIMLGLTRPPRKGEAAGMARDSGRGWALTPNGSYDLLLAAALRSLGSGPRNLDVTDPWRWLLLEFAQNYGVRESYAALTYLLWAVHPSRATPTADCFNMLVRELRPLKQAYDEGLLQATEMQMFRSVTASVEQLLARCFENYKLLSELSATGIVHDGAPGAEIPAPALEPAIALFYLLRDPLDPASQKWMTERFRTAARRRYLRLEVSCFEEKEPPGDPRDRAAKPEHSDVVNARREYLQLESLCSTLCLDLQIDMVLHKSEVLPSFLNLPSIVAEEYCAELVKHLTALLRFRPPTSLSAAAIKLLVAVGALQSFLVQHELTPRPDSPAYLDAQQLFGEHVLIWIHVSKEYLIRENEALEQTLLERQRRDRRALESGYADGVESDGRFRRFESGDYADAVSGKSGESVSPIVKEIVQILNAEVRKYEEVVATWPVFAPPLEGAVCDVIREILASLCRQSGGVPSQVRKQGGLPGTRVRFRSPLFKYITIHVLVPRAHCPAEHS